jgi:hypothetical protein
MKKLLLMLFVVSFVCPLSLHADIFPEEQPDNFILSFRFHEYPKPTDWSIAISTSGILIIMPEGKEPEEIQIRPDEISHFWDAAKKYFRTFKLKEYSNDPRRKKIDVTFVLGQGPWGDSISIQDYFNDLNDESESLKKIIELCNQYLSEEFQVK